MADHPRNPYLTVDAIVRLNEGQHIVLIKRKNPPFGLALPGGFVEYGESVEDAICRELLEETRIKNLDLLTQFHTYSDPNRDPRQHNASVVFLAWSHDVPVAGDDAAEIVLVDPWDIKNLDFAFDHKQILTDWTNHRFRL